MLKEKPRPLEIPGDFDWLIILDACRYDYFVKLWPLLGFSGYVFPRFSPASCTLEFLKWLKPIKDSIVLTGHPFVLNAKDKFTKIVDVGFDYYLNTSPPWYITQYLKRNFDKVAKFKHKILWFLQPHHPHIGRYRLNAGIYSSFIHKELTPQEKTTRLFERAYHAGTLSKSYKSNLWVVLKELRKILPMLKGKIIITSDHGEGLGEPLRPEDKLVFSHPCGREEWEVRVVPFVEMER